MFRRLSCAPLCRSLSRVTGLSQRSVRVTASRADVPRLADRFAASSAPDSAPARESVGSSKREPIRLFSSSKSSSSSSSSSEDVSPPIESYLRSNSAVWSALLAAGVVAFSFLALDPSEAEETIEEAVAGVSDLRDGELKAVKVGSTDILLARVNGEFFATDLKCTHMGVPLNNGLLNGEKVVCGAHDAAFSVRTGNVLSGPALPESHLRTYPVRVADGRVLVSVPAKPREAVKGRCDHCDVRTFVIVGAGAAGLAAAEALRQEGFRGRIVMITREESLPYDRTSLSKGVGTPTEKLLLRDEAFYRAHDIEVHRGRVVKQLDAKAKTIQFEDGSTLAYDAALLATGSRPRTLSVPGSGLEHVHTLRSMADAAAIQQSVADAQRVVIVGSSFVGCELAAALKKSQKQLQSVTVVGMEAVPFERVLGRRVGSVLQRQQEENGVQFRLGRVVRSMEGAGGRVKRVVLDNGDELPADVVVVGVGVQPETGYVRNVPLNSDGSVSTDARMRVAAADALFAAGDVARFPFHGELIRPEHWAAAQNTGRVAARNMAVLGSGKEGPEFSAVPFFWTRSWDTSLQCAGQATHFEEVIVHGDEQKRQFVAYYVQKEKERKAERVVAVATMGKGPAAMAAAELMAEGRMPTPAELRQTDLVDLVALFKATRGK